jgi:outer membrane protein assembly factor BamB
LSKSQLVVFDARTGHQVWNAAINAQGYNHFALGERLVGVLTAGGVIKGLDLASGATRWRASGFPEAPTGGVEIDGTNGLFVAERTGFSPQEPRRIGSVQLVALEGSSGHERWRYAVEPNYQVLGVTFDGRGAIAQTRGPVDSPTPVEPEGKLVGIDLATGKPTWQSSLGVWESFSRVVATNGTVFFSGSTSASESAQLPGAFEVGSRLVALDASSGSIRWERRGDDSQSPMSMAAGDGNLYTVSSDGTLTSLDGRTGAAQWQLRTRAAGAAPSALSLATAGGGIVGVVHRTTRTGGSFDALDAESGHIRWSTHKPAQGAAVTKGSVFLTGGGSSRDCN